jgi:hypothetical protein
VTGRGARREGISEYIIFEYNMNDESNVAFEDLEGHISDWKEDYMLRFWRRK